MTDTNNTLTEDDGDELIPVETKPEDDKAAADEAADDADADDEDDDGEDSRLATSEDDSDDEITSSNRKRRQKRREMQKRAKEAAEREIALLRRQNEELSRRMASLEGHANQSAIQTIEQRLAQVQAEIQQAEYVIAKATEAGNGEDVVAAMRIRDEAQRKAQQLEQVRQSAARPATPQVDPNVVSYAKQWMAANPWYDPQGGDRHSALTKGIDNELAREGYNPATREYWEELTNRVSEALGGDDDEPTQKTTADRPRRKAPPIGTTRQHAPASTKREIYVTPERKQAMIEAGVWDDPERRQRYLKAYQAYDTGSAR